VRHYAFRDGWVVPHPRAAVHGVLVDVEHYPQWWPQVRAVVRIGEDDGLVACRSLLPYTLHLHLTTVHRRPDLLETSIDGDLVGSVRWRLTEHPDGTDLAFEQEVTVAGRMLAAGSYVARPALRWNHARMMAGCRAGLAARLAQVPSSGVDV
jgi:hypothetical protein